MVLEIPLWAAGPEGNEFEHSAILDRRLIEGLYQNGGVVTSNSFVVSQRAAGANMSVDVSPGKCVIPGTHVSNQGSYYCRSTSVQNRTVAAAPGTGSRTDIVIARTYDSEVQGLVDEFAIEVLTGTTTVPNDAILLAEILVSAGNAAVVNSMISDERSLATARPEFLTGLELPQPTQAGHIATKEFVESGSSAARGIIAYLGTSASPTFTTLTHLITINNVPFVAGRAYDVSGYLRAKASTEQAVLTTWCEAFVRIDGTIRGMDRQENVSRFAVGERPLFPRRIWLPTSTASVTVTLSIQLNTVPSGAVGNVSGSAAIPATLSVTDIGLAP